MKLITLVILLVTTQSFTPPLPHDEADPPPYETLWFEQPVDHFNRDAGSFKVKVLVQKTNADENSPLFIYTGNESPITDFYAITGFLTGTLQEQFNAKVAFIEHRYFGESIPKKGIEYEYLNTEQVLWDFADITMQLKAKQETPVIAVGGSYGGMLAAMFRIKYPHVVDGALASSAPLLAQHQDGEAFSRIVSKVYSDVDNDCAQLIDKAFQALRVLSREFRLYNAVTESMNLCTPLKTNYEFLQLAEYIKAGLVFMTEYNYPYPTEVLGATLPANPIEAACVPLENFEKSSTDDTWDLLSALMQAAGVYYNAGNADACHQIDDFEVFETGSWPYQKCTELLFPLGSNGVDDIFNYNPWDLKSWNESCQEAYGSKTRLAWENVNYGLYTNIKAQLRYASNIIFSNGDKDPWSYGGIMTDLNEKLFVIIIENASHHMDLRSPNKDDPQSVIDARGQEISIIKYWIEEKAKA